MSEPRGCLFRTALGWAGVAASERGIMLVVLPRADRETVRRLLAGAGVRMHRTPLLRKAVKRLADYFAGERVVGDLPLDLGNATPFQRSAWKAAAAIPYGTTRPYAWVAQRAGSPRAARAVGQAMAANPVPVLIP